MDNLQHWSNCVHIVPTSAPLNVSGRAINSTTIIVNWELPALDGRNGNITGYSLIIRELATNTTTTLSQSGVHIEAVIASLHPYYEYDCQIAAETAVGRGPYGDTVTTMTLPDGMLTCVMHRVVVSLSRSQLLYRQPEPAQWLWPVVQGEPALPSPFNSPF